MERIYLFLFTEFSIGKILFIMIVVRQLTRQILQLSARIKLVIGSVVKSDLDRVPANFTSHLDCTCKQIAVENSTFIIFVNREYGA